MTILTIDEQTAAIADVQTIIESTGDLATIKRPTKTEPQPDDPFGEIEDSETQIAIDIPIEFIALAPEQIIQQGHDRVANVLPDTDVAENDFIIDQANTNIRYRITNVVIHNLFGAITHKELRLERAYKETSP